MTFRGPFASHDSNPYPNRTMQCQARRRSSDATSKASFPLHDTEARQHQGNLDVTSDVVLSCCCCPSAGAEFCRKFGGNFGGFFSDPKNKGSKISGKFRSTFREKIRALNMNISCQLRSADVPPKKRRNEPSAQDKKTARVFRGFLR